MALTDESMGTTMLVQPAGNAGNGFGFGDGNGFWILLLFLLLGNNGWGNGFGGGFDGGLYPWMNNSQNINNGFRDQMLNDNITSIRDGVYGISTQLCNGFAGVNAGIANGFAQAEIANNARQIADMQQAFAAQTATMQGFNGLQSQLAQCCCDNRAATQDVKYTIATEACATRSANAQNTQAILDKLCQLELDGYKQQVEAKNDQIGQLRSQLQYANMQASQVDQTAQLRTSQATVANQLVAELRSCPIPSQPVYGNQPIFTCGGNTAGCGCGCGVA
jgi:hypothetical protein